MQEVIEQPRRLSSTEDCPRFSDIAFDAKVLNGATCTLKRFFQQVDQQKELSCNNATAVLAVYRCLLQKSDNDFVASARAEQKVFKVSQEAEGQRLVSVGEPVRVAAGTRRRLTLSTSMHIVLCIKKVPGSAQVRVHPVTNTIMRQGVSAIQFFTRHPHLVALFQNLCRVDVGRRTYPSKSYEVCTNDCSEKPHVRVPSFLLSGGEQGLGQANCRRLPGMP